MLLISIWRKEMEECFSFERTECKLIHTAYTTTGNIVVVAVENIFQERMKAAELHPFVSAFI